MFSVSTSRTGASAIHQMPRPIPTYFVNAGVAHACISIKKLPEPPPEKLESFEQPAEYAVEKNVAYTPHTAGTGKAVMVTGTLVKSAEPETGSVGTTKQPMSTSIVSVKPMLMGKLITKGTQAKKQWTVQMNYIHTTQANRSNARE